MCPYKAYIIQTFIVVIRYRQTDAINETVPGRGDAYLHDNHRTDRLLGGLLYLYTLPGIRPCHPDDDDDLSL